MMQAFQVWGKYIREVVFCCSEDSECGAGIYLTPHSFLGRANLPGWGTLSCPPRKPGHGEQYLLRRTRCGARWMCALGWVAGCSLAGCIGTTFQIKGVPLKQISWLCPRAVLWLTARNNLWIYKLDAH